MLEDEKRDYHRHHHHDDNRCVNFLQKRNESRDYEKIRCYNEYLAKLDCFTGQNCSDTIEGTGFCGWDFIWYENSCLANRTGIQYDAPTNGTCITDISEDCFKVANLTCLLGRITSILTNVRLGILLQPNTSTPLVDNLFADLYGLCDVNGTDFYRRAGGECNNPLIPGSGARGARILRHNYTINLDNEEKLKNDSYPNAWTLASKLLRRRNETNPKLHNTGVNMLAAAWVNFFIHDFFAATENPKDTIMTEIEGDKTIKSCPYHNHRKQKQYYEMSRHKPRQDNGTDPFPINAPGRRDFRNRVTAWFDGSQLYGNSLEVSNEQRSFVDGKLKINANGTMLSKNFFTRENDGFLKTTRVDSDVPPLFQSGDVDDRANRWFGTTAFQNLWILEHNNVATLLKLSPDGSSMTDEQLYQTARLITTAEIVKVHLLEWTNQMFDDPTAQQVQGISWAKVGIPRTPTEKISTMGVPFDFVADYRWHAMINENVAVVDPDTRNKTGEVINVFDSLMNTTAHRTLGLKKLLVSLASTPAHDIHINNLAKDFFGLKELFESEVFPKKNEHCPLYPYMNIGVNDILRGRDHAVPNFNQQRRIVGLKPVEHFLDFDLTPEEAVEMASLYGWDVENVDFHIGMLAERKASFEGFPSSVLASFIPFVFSRLRFDRFYTDDFNVLHYTSFGIDRLKPSIGPGVTLAQIINETLNYDVAPHQGNIFKLWN